MNPAGLRSPQARAATLERPPKPRRADKPLSLRLSLLVWAVMAASAWGLCALVLHFL